MILPSNAIFEVYHGCNWNCVMCGDPFSSTNVKVEDPGDEKVFEVAHAIGKSGLFHASLSGGDPIVKPERTLKVIDILKSYNLSVNMNSNISLANREFFQELKKRGSIGILISLHSFDQTAFENIVNKKGAFKKVLANLEIALEEGMYIAPNMVVMNSNVKDIIPTAEFLNREFGIDNFCLTPIAASIPKHKNLLVKPEDIETILDTVFELTLKKGIHTRILRSLPFCSVENFEKYSPLLTMTCPAGKSLVTIGPDGDVRTCAHDSSNYGNILNENLATIHQRFDLEKNYPEYCKLCNYVNDCRTGCVIETGLFENGSPYQRFSAKMNKIPKESVFSVNLINLKDEKLLLPKSLRHRKEIDGTITTVVDDHIANLNEEEFSFYRLINTVAKNRVLDINKFSTESGISIPEMNPFLNKLLLSGLLKIYKNGKNN